ncbi:MAG: hypothetical protein ACR2PL_22935 [Dehalococcoidia bacterium]
MDYGYLQEQIRLVEVLQSELEAANSRVAQQMAVTAVLEPGNLQVGKPSALLELEQMLNRQEAEIERWMRLQMLEADALRRTREEVHALLQRLEKPRRSAWRNGSPIGGDRW